MASLQIEEVANGPPSTQTTQEDIHEMRRAPQDNADSASTARCPIHRLPSELVIELIFTCRDADPPSEVALFGSVRSVSYGTPDIGWIKLTHVCCRWRELALGTCMLWDRIVFILGDRWSQEMFSRSSGALLTVDSRVENVDSRIKDRTNSTLRRLVVENLARTAGLHLTGPNPALIGALVSPAPELRLLNIDNYNPLPPAFLGGDAPLLQHLSLSSSTSFPWGLSFLGNIRTVAIGPPRYDQSATTLVALLDALGKMPLLESCALNGWLGTGPGATVPTHRMVELPCLASLSISGNPADCASFLQCLCAPTTARLAVSTTSHLPDALAALCASVHTFLRISPARPLFRIACAPRGRHLLATLAFADSTRAGACPSHAPAEHAVPHDGGAELQLWSERDREADIVHAVCGAFASAQLRALDLDAGADCPWTPQDWRATMVRATGVECVRVAGDAAASLALALAPAPPLFPALRRLALVRASLNFRRGAPGGPAQRPWGALKRSLEVRASGGCGLEALSMVHCTLLSILVDEFRELVPRFEWCGVDRAKT